MYTRNRTVNEKIYIKVKIKADFFYIKRKGCEKYLYKIKKSIKTICIILAIIILSFLNFKNAVKASDLNTANIQSIGNCGYLLKYQGIIVETFYAAYMHEGKSYPAYCLDKTKHGVSDANPSYEVSIEDSIKDVKLWRILINGYPYKTIEELGVANKEEAFTATKQAVYTYIHGNQLSDYEAIGEAGQRTLNALYKIVNDANNSTEIQISNQVAIEKLQENWEQDNIDVHYVSKTYKVSSKTNIDNYKVSITDENGQAIEGIKITNENNEKKEEFNANEVFKILIPIKNMTEDKHIKINIETKIETKPILYGKASDSNLQDYALTASTYENGMGNIQDIYTKNETKIIIIKQDEETKEKLQGVEFQLLDENKNVIYTNLQTDSNGMVKVENLIPGKYYIKETKTISGYELYEALIQVDVNLNEEMTVTVNNREEEKPKVEKTIDNKEFTSKKILPVTGM